MFLAYIPPSAQIANAAQSAYDAMAVPAATERRKSELKPTPRDTELLSSLKQQRNALVRDGFGFGERPSRMVAGRSIVFGDRNSEPGR